MISITGSEVFNVGIDKWLDEVEALAVDSLRGLAIKVFQTAINNSPQFSGNAVANWKFSVNSVDYSSEDVFKDIFYENITPEKIAFSKLNRNDVAEEFAMAEARGKELKVLKLRDRIFISNSVEYADWLAKATEADLRAVNHVGHLISHTIADVTEAHFIINTATARALAAERI